MPLKVFTSPLDKVLVRVLTIQCYYELQDDDLLESVLEATRKHISRNNGLGEAFRVQIRNFLRLTLQLDIARKSATTQEAVAPILAELAKGKVCASQYWVEQQAAALSE